MTPSRRILFLTNSEYGQANVILAAIHSLLHIAPDVELHVASFAGLEAPLRQISDHAKNAASAGSPASSVHFHLLSGISYYEATERPENSINDLFDLAPGLVNTSRVILNIPGIMQAWRPDEFVGIYRETEAVVKKVEPDLVVVEPIFTPGLTLCHHAGLNWIVFAPNTIKDFVLPLQPRLAALWKYPMYVADRGSVLNFKVTRESYADTAGTFVPIQGSAQPCHSPYRAI